MAKTRYQVLVNGVVESECDTSAEARRIAEAICARDGLVDDGAYCGDDGWPAIVRADGQYERIDYDAPTT